MAKFSDVFRLAIEATEKHTAAPLSEDERAALRAAIQAEFGGKRIYIAPIENKDARNVRIHRDRNSGVSVPTLMRKYELSRPAIYKILKQKK